MNLIGIFTIACLLWHYNTYMICKSMQSERYISSIIYDEEICNCWPTKINITYSIFEIILMGSLMIFLDWIALLRKIQISLVIECTYCTIFFMFVMHEFLMDLVYKELLHYNNICLVKISIV